MISALLSLLGFCFLATAFVVALLKIWDRRLLGRLSRAPRMTVAELSAAWPLPDRVVMTGRTAPGKKGCLTSPAFGTPCVWFQTEVVAPGGEYATTLVRREDGDGHFGLRDATGVVAVDLALALVVDSHTTIHQARGERATLRRGRPLSAGSGLAALEAIGWLGESMYGRWLGRSVELTERTIAIDQELTVLARPRRDADGTVILAGRGDLTAGSPKEWKGRLERDLITARWMTRIFPMLGLALWTTGCGVGAVSGLY